MSTFDEIIFKNKKLSDILEEVYINQKTKQKQISELINQLKPLIVDIGDASLIVPLLKEYLDIGVKNDDQLIKLSTVIQRILQNKTGNEDGGLGISEEEKKQLFSEIKSIKDK